VTFKSFADPFEFRERLRHQRLQGRLVPAALFASGFRDGLRRANSRHHVLALCVNKEFAVKPGVTG
jgi:hypothetical protein